MTDTASWIGLGVAAVSAIAAVAAWRAADGSRKAAAELTAIERDRRHAELTPKILAQVSPLGGGRFRLRIQLDGPLELEGLDHVVVSVRNDTVDHTPIDGGGTNEESNAPIWGPLRFVPQIDGASEDGRQVAPFPLAVGDDRPFAMEPTRAPLESGPGSDSWWRAQYQSGTSPLRLAVRCEKEGEQPWIIPIELHLSKYEFEGSAS
ncbi:hypothetical protein [Leifsonia xyli]|uniref:hypothetical protein n=1 Tax=Leifsonia xyli TaxID=1575 RepID=UPI003D67317B